MNVLFANTEASLPIVLLRAREAMMKRLRPLLTRHDLSEQQWRVLRLLDESGPMEPTELSEKCMILTPSLTRIFSSLEGRKMIHREPHLRDKRKQVIHLTKVGQDVLLDIAPQAHKTYDDLEKTLGKKQIADLMSKLNKLADY